ncbi:hypothetical protein Tco_1075201 [Tanacetum coccineum]
MNVLLDLAGKLPGVTMLLCKQAEKGVPPQVEQSDWLADTDEKIDEQELEAYYNFMEKIQEVPTANSGTDTEPLEQVDSNVIPDLPDMCDNDIQTDQNVVECDDEHVALANLIANLKLDGVTMLLCKQAEKGVPLQVEQSDWLADWYEKIYENKNWKHYYNVMEKIRRLLTATYLQNQIQLLSHWNSNTCLVEKDDINVTLDSPDMCENDIQTDQNVKDEHAALANLISNLKLDVDENKKDSKAIKESKHITLS